MLADLDVLRRTGDARLSSRRETDTVSLAYAAIGLTEAPDVFPRVSRAEIRASTEETETVDED